MWTKTTFDRFIDRYDELYGSSWYKTRLVFAGEDIRIFKGGMYYDIHYKKILNDFESALEEVRQGLSIENFKTVFEY